MNYRILSGSWLKLIAVVCMLIDHLAAFYLFKLPVMHTELFMLGHHAVTPLLMMRLVGRLAFPIFAFLIVEGFLHTRSRVRYGRNLLIFALLSELPWNLIHSGTWHYPSQNVFFTLLLGYLGLCALEYFKDDSRRLLASLLGLLVASVLMRADYGCSGYESMSSNVSTPSSPRQRSLSCWACPPARRPRACMPAW